MDPKPRRRTCALAVAGGLIGLGLLALPALAQDLSDVEELRRVIEAQQRQLEAQQEQLEAQEQLLLELQAKLDALVRDAASEEIAATAEEPPAEPIQEPPRGKGRVSERDRYDLESPTASGVTYFDPAARAMIPDTKTEVSVHGLAELQMFHDTTGLNNNRFDTATIPVDGGPSQTKFSVNPSQLAVSSTTPVSHGRLNTWFSLDMNGQLDRPDPRVRIAFGEYVNDERGFGVLLGQTYSTMLDLRAVPETLDFALPAGLWAQRQPLARVSKSLGDSLTAEVSVETPENVSYTVETPENGSSTDAKKRTQWPDLAAAGTWYIDGRYLKHLRLAGLARDLEAEVADGSTDSALGWAVSGSTKLGLPFLEARDNLKLTLHFGDGYGTQLKGGPKEGVFNLDTLELETIGIFGTFGGLQHFWSDRFRSNLAFGHVEADNPGFVGGDTMKSTTYFAADIIWTPFPTTKFGFEYLWGRRIDEDGESGTSNRFLLSSMFVF